MIAGVINCAGLNLVLIAYQNANPSIVGLFMYIGVAYNFLVDKFFFTLDLDALQILGLTISMSFTVLVAIRRMHE